MTGPYFDLNLPSPRPLVTLNCGGASRFQCVLGRVSNKRVVRTLDIVKVLHDCRTCARDPLLGTGAGLDDMELTSNEQILGKQEKLFA